MTIIQLIAMAVPLALPGVGFLTGLTVGRGSLVAGIAGSSLAGAATGAYIGAAAAPPANGGWPPLTIILVHDNWSTRTVWKLFLKL